MRSARTSRMRALVWRRVGDDAGLRAGQRDRLVAEVVDRHRAQRAARSARRWRAACPSRAGRGSARPPRPSRSARRSSCRAPTARRPRGGPARGRATIRRAARLRRSASATEVPPNFMTTVLRCSQAPPSRPASGAAERDLVGVLEVGADRQAGGEAGDRDVGRALAERRRRCGARSPRRSSSGWWRARPRGRRLGLDARVELGDLQVLGLDAVDRRQRAAEHVVAAAVLVRALDRDHVAGLLDDADQRRRRGARPGRSCSAGPRRG